MNDLGASKGLRTQRSRAGRKKHSGLTFRVLGLGNRGTKGERIHRRKNEMGRTNDKCPWCRRLSRAKMKVHGFSSV